jgi:hypothetical protein
VGAVGADRAEAYLARQTGAAAGRRSGSQASKAALSLGPRWVRAATVE